LRAVRFFSPLFRRPPPSPLFPYTTLFRSFGVVDLCLTVRIFIWVVAHLIQSDAHSLQITRQMAQMLDAVDGYCMSWEQKLHLFDHVVNRRSCPFFQFLGYVRVLHHRRRESNYGLPDASWNFRFDGVF